MKRNDQNSNTITVNADDVRAVLQSAVFIAGAPGGPDPEVLEVAVQRLADAVGLAVDGQ